MVEKEIEASQCLNANHEVLCHLKNSRTLKLLTTSGAKPSRVRFELSALKNSRNLVKKSSIHPIDHGGKHSFQWYMKIRVARFTTHQQGRAWLFFTHAMTTKACGICRGAA